ncbi:4'-phosphopantetheinyl transferase superfamily protein [Pelagicoccus sp. SDUM812002]|uniref:4'-phosphopantetheinyl transferase family protein n=1 Tax=Pelagicoccus sp. SDUM812002 TaxID=3041266 RepID=UPI0028125C5B|nr:4'-phosphopantetheinyl transferase superfamily protein [Pelagicoccus sp. SDUM812002]
MSHSSNVALMAIAMGVDVGIDVEETHADIEYLDLAERFFSQSEYRAILASPAEDRILSFYRCWTGKEALVKAIGEGLSIPFDSFSISVGREASQVIKMNSEQKASTHWTVRQIDVGRRYRGSLAYEGEERKVTCLDWNCSNLKL